jgi:hypothetical protein
MPVQCPAGRSHAAHRADAGFVDWLRERTCQANGHWTCRRSQARVPGTLFGVISLNEVASLNDREVARVPITVRRRSEGTARRGTTGSETSLPRDGRTAGSRPTSAAKKIRPAGGYVTPRIVASCGNASGAAAPLARNPPRTGIDTSFGIDRFPPPRVSWRRGDARASAARPRGLGCLWGHGSALLPLHNPNWVPHRCRSPRCCAPSA